MERFFQVKEHGSTVKTEIMAGITTFMAMAYILMVNAGMFADPFGDGTNVLGVSYGAVYVATAISAVALPSSPIRVLVTTSRTRSVGWLISRKKFA